MFTWKKEYELGIQVIDEQHKRLFAIGEESDQLIKNSRGSEIPISQILDLIKRLVEYTEYHFETEEQLMQAYGYSDFAAHKTEHISFVNYLTAINLKEVHDDQTAFLQYIVNYLAEWVRHHITTIDFMYRDFLKQNGVS